MVDYAALKNCGTTKAGQMMKIGITFDLRDDYAKEGYAEEEIAEFDRLETIEAIEFGVALTGSFDGTYRYCQGAGNAVGSRRSVGSRF